MTTFNGLGDSTSTAKELYRALATGDRNVLAMLLCADFIGHAAEGLPLSMGGEHRGPEAMQRNLWWRIGKHFSVTAEPDEFHVLDDGRLLVAGHYRGVARVSGKPLDAAFTHVIGFADDGRITSLDQLTDTAAWVEALGDGAPLEPLEQLGKIGDRFATITVSAMDWMADALRKAPSCLRPARGHARAWSSPPCLAAQSAGPVPNPGR